MKILPLSALAAAVFLTGPFLVRADGPDAKDAQPKSGRHAVASASEKSLRRSKKATPEEVSSSGRPQYRILTGSHIPQRFTQYGLLTDSSLPVTIVDRGEIMRLEGGPTLSSTLSMIPSVTVVGH